MQKALCNTQIVPVSLFGGPFLAGADPPFSASQTAPVSTRQAGVMYLSESAVQAQYVRLAHLGPPIFADADFLFSDSSLLLKDVYGDMKPMKMRLVGKLERKFSAILSWEEPDGSSYQY